MTAESTKRIKSTRTARIIDVNVQLVSLTEAASIILDAAAVRSALSCSLVGMHTITNAHRSDDVRCRLTHVDVQLLDSAPATFFLRLMGHKVPKRIRGQDLMNEVCRLCAERKLSVFFFGAETSTLVALVQRLGEKYPDLQVAGYRAGRYRQLGTEEIEEDIQAIRQSNADVVFVGLGSPRQDVWVYEMSAVLGRPLIAVGAAFDFESGKVRPAPKIMQEVGLEWLYRLLRNPRRLWRRYLLDGPYFLWLLVRQMVGALPVRTCDRPADRLNYG